MRNDDLISRAEAIDVVRSLQVTLGGKQIFHPEAKKSVIGTLDDLPTIDAVEVIRCKDCKHRGFAGECPMCYTEDAYDEDYGYDYWDVDKTTDEGFCHCGERDAEVSNDA